MPILEKSRRDDPVKCTRVESVLALISNGYCVGDAFIRAKLPKTTMRGRVGTEYEELIKEAVANRRMQVSDVVSEKMKKD